MTFCSVLDWPDFQRAVAQVTRQDYRWFFDQWLHRSGLPQVQLTAVKSVLADGSYLITAQVTQTGMPYRLRLPVVLKTTDAEIVRQALEINGPSTPLQIRSQSAPLRLDLDPEGAVLMAGAAGGEQADPFASTFPHQ